MLQDSTQQWPTPKVGRLGEGSMRESFQTVIFKKVTFQLSLKLSLAKEERKRELKFPSAARRAGMNAERHGKGWCYHHTTGNL